MGANPEVTRKRTGMLHRPRAGIPWVVAESGLPTGAADNALSGQHVAAAVLDIVRPAGHADRIQVALLAAVGHDLRSPLAAAKVAISCLRSRDVQLTPADHDDLLATAEESLDLLARLAAILVDMTRLQAGGRATFPCPADLEEIICGSLDSLGSSAQAVRVSIPPGLPGMMADPAIMERVVANVTANALRYSPAGSPPLLTASARGDRVELRVVDRGPGVPEHDRERMFLPFERLGERGGTTSVGLGLAVSRGLTEAMHGTLRPGQTPGGGLTMIISMPAAGRGAGQQR
jgi:two-component system, OmpR family, sensor histidine kinase KdpD